MEDESYFQSQAVLQANEESVGAPLEGSTARCVAPKLRLPQKLSCRESQSHVGGPKLEQTDHSRSSLVQ